MLKYFTSNQVSSISYENKWNITVNGFFKATIVVFLRTNYGPSRIIVTSAPGQIGTITNKDLVVLIPKVVISTPEIFIEYVLQ